jgi:hypothetical protein
VVDSHVARLIPPDAQATLTYLCLTIFGYGFGIFAAFYGIAGMVRGFLIFRSGYLPRALGMILICGGLSFVTLNFLIVLAPQYNVPYLIAPMLLAMVSMMLWLLVKGVDRTRWDEMQTREATAGN